MRSPKGTNGLRVVIALASYCFLIGHTQLLNAIELEFVGNSSITTGAIKSELNGHPEYFLIDSKAQDIQSAARLVERLVGEGYQSSGFPDSEVSVSVLGITDAKSERLQVAINEGPRFCNNAVHVQGLDQKLSSMLVEQLTTQQPLGKAFPSFVNFNGTFKIVWKDLKGEEADLRDPIWPQGKFTEFSRQKRLETNVLNAMNRMGYPHASLKVSLHRVEESKLAELHVDINELGSVRQAKSIYIVGVVQSQREDVLQFLNLKEGDPISIDREYEIIRKLWECGRFTQHSVEWDSDESDVLKINLEIAQGVPWVTEPLDENAQTILLARQWVSELIQRGEDCSFTSKRDAARIIVSKQGTYLEVSDSTSGVVEDDTASKTSVLIDSKGILVDSDELSEHLYIPSPVGKVCVEMSARNRQETAFKMPGEQGPTRIFGGNFIIGGSTSRRSDENAMSLKLTMNPAGWLPIAYRKDLKFSSDGKDLVISGNGCEMIIDRETGRIRKVTEDEDTFQFGYNLLNEVTDKFPQKSNRFDSKRPVFSAFDYYAEPVFWRGLKNAGSPEVLLRSALSKMSATKTFQLLEDLVAMKLFEVEEVEYFNIPTGMLDESSGAKFTDIEGVEVALLLLALKIGSNFEDNTWPSEVVGVEATQLLGLNSETKRKIDAILSNKKNGPICLAALAFCLEMHEDPRTSEVASEGLKRMDASRIDHDWKDVTAGVDQEYVDDFFRAARSLSDEELDVLCDLIDVEPFTLALRAIHNSDTDGNVSLGAVFAETQGALLEYYLRKASQLRFGPSEASSAKVDRNSKHIAQSNP